MSRRAELLASRRRRLVAQSQALRIELTLQLEPLARSLATIDCGLRILARIRQHPEWIAGAAVALFLLRPSRLSGWMRDAAFGLRAWRRAAPLARLLVR